MAKSIEKAPETKREEASKVPEKKKEIEEKEKEHKVEEAQVLIKKAVPKRQKYKMKL